MPMADVQLSRSPIAPVRTVTAWPITADWYLNVPRWFSTSPLLSTPHNFGVRGFIPTAAGEDIDFLIYGAHCALLSDDLDTIG